MDVVCTVGTVQIARENAQRRAWEDGVCINELCLWASGCQAHCIHPLDSELIGFTLCYRQSQTFLIRKVVELELRLADAMTPEASSLMALAQMPVQYRDQRRTTAHMHH